MVILRGETEDGDVAIMFSQFFVLNQRSNRKLVALSVSPERQVRAIAEGGLKTRGKMSSKASAV